MLHVSDDIPEPWKTAIERKGISPTYRPLAAAAGLSHETVRKVVQGRRTSNTSIRKVADLLGVPVETIHGWRGEAAPDYGREFVPDQSASLLTTEEREAVNNLIRLLVRSRDEQKAGEGHADRPAPKTVPGPAKAGPGGFDAKAELESLTLAGVSDDAYVLAARNDDDDAESEAQQNEP